MSTSFQYVLENIPSTWTYVSHEWDGAIWAVRPPLLTSHCAGFRSDPAVTVFIVNWTDYHETVELDHIEVKVRFQFVDGEGVTREEEVKTSINIRIRRIRSFLVSGPNSINQCCPGEFQFCGVGFNDNAGNSQGYTFNWTIPANWTITSSPNSECITVIPDPTTGGSISLTVGRTNTTVTRTATLNITRPVNKFSINGPPGDKLVCPGEQITFNSNVPPCGSYTINWTVPSGWIIVSGQGTPTITVAPTISATEGNITITGNMDQGGCMITPSARYLIYLTEPPPVPQILELGTTDLPHINWIDRRWHVCKGGISTLIELYPALRTAQSYTFSVSSPWKINGQTGPVVTSDPWIFVSGPANAPISGTLSVRANNCIGSSAWNNYLFLRNDGPIPCGDGNEPVKSLTTSNHAQTIMAYPNPVKDELIISSGNYPVEKIYIKNYTGRILTTLQGLKPNGIWSLSTSMWKPGLYFVEAHSKGHPHSIIKVIKQ